MNENCIAVNERPCLPFEGDLAFCITQACDANIVYFSRNLAFPCPLMNCVRSLMQPVLFPKEFSARIESRQSFKILGLAVQILVRSYLFPKAKRSFFCCFFFGRPLLEQGWFRPNRTESSVLEAEGTGIQLLVVFGILPREERIFLMS